MVHTYFRVVAIFVVRTTRARGHICNTIMFKHSFSPSPFSLPFLKISRQKEEDALGVVLFRETQKREIYAPQNASFRLSILVVLGGSSVSRWIVTRHAFGDAADAGKERTRDDF